MDISGPTFVLLIILLSTGGWLINNWIRAKHGYDLEDEMGGKTSLGGTSGEVAELRAEQAKLIERLDASEDRIVVLEKIVTDRGYSLSDEIEALRDARRDHGVPLESGNKETA